MLIVCKHGNALDAHLSSELRVSFMLGRVLLVIVIAVSVVHSADAAPRFPEYLCIDNQGNETVWVSIKAKGQASTNRSVWQREVAVSPSRRTQTCIRLRGYEPFDIVVIEKDGGATLYRNVPLCTIMDKCRKRQKYPRQWEPIFGRVIGRAPNLRFVESTEVRAGKHEIRANSQCVTIPVFVDPPEPPVVP
jgi:hypothetical protein